MARIICLANSYKHEGRCIAGIDIDTGKWIRPVTQIGDAIYNERLIDGTYEPQLLDLLEIPLGGQAPDRGCQPENRFLEKGVWRLIRHLSVSEINEYVEDTKNLLHNQDKKVDPEILKKMPQSDWKSLQLIHVSSPNFIPNPFNPQKNPICTFTYFHNTYELKVTDTTVIDKIRRSQNISKECLFTVSMASPYKSPAYDKEYCWKMIAGVIEL